MTTEAVKAQVREIILELEEIRLRPGLYIGPDAMDIVSFLNGFNCAFGTLGLSFRGGREYTELFEQIVNERGWCWNASRTTADLMEEHGYTYKEIVDEWLVINIELWKRTFDVF